MKKNKKLKFIIAGMSTALAVFVSTSFANIIPSNAGFDDGTLNGWSAVGTASSIEASAEESRNGSYSCQFENPSSAFTGRGIESASLLNLVAATGDSNPSDNKAFSLSAWFFVAEEAGEIEDTEIQLYVKWYDSSGSELSGKETGYVSGVELDYFAGWQEVAVTLMAAPAGAFYARVCIAANESVNNDNDVYVDHVQFTYTDMPAYLKTIGLKTFNTVVGQEDEELKVFFPYSTPAGKSSSCRIVFNLPDTPITEQRVNVLVYDVKGRLVRSIVKGEEFLAKHYDYTWDGRDVNMQFLPCGMYIISVELADQDTGGVIKEQTVVAIGRKL